MIDKPEVIITTETTDAGPSPYLPLAIYLLTMTDADAVAVVVINGKYGNGGTGVGLTVEALEKLPPALRGVADLQAQEAAAWRAKGSPP